MIVIRESIIDNSKNIMTKKETRKFGIIAFIFFTCLCAISIWRDKEIVTWFFGTLAFFGFSLLLLPGPLAPLHSGWLKVAHFIGKTITIILMSTAYYLVITPSAVIKRIFGGRPIPLKPDKNRSTYWVERTEPAQPKERFFKRF